MIITAGVEALGAHEVASLLVLVREFKEFSEANDPYGEHDFGALNHGGERFFWKIDYYDRKLALHSPDPADPAVTERVLTLMLADEY